MVEAVGWHVQILAFIRVKGFNGIETILRGKQRGLRRTCIELHQVCKVALVTFWRESLKGIPFGSHALNDLVGGADQPLSSSRDQL